MVQPVHMAQPDMPAHKPGKPHDSTPPCLSSQRPGKPDHALCVPFFVSGTALTRCKSPSTTCSVSSDQQVPCHLHLGVNTSYKRASHYALQAAASLATHSGQLQQPGVPAQLVVLGPPAVDQQRVLVASCPEQRHRVASPPAGPRHALQAFTPTQPAGQCWAGALDGAGKQESHMVHLLRAAHPHPVISS